MCRAVTTPSVTLLPCTDPDVVSGIRWTGLGGWMDGCREWQANEWCAVTRSCRRNNQDENFMTISFEPTSATHFLEFSFLFALS